VVVATTTIGLADDFAAFEDDEDEEAESSELPQPPARAASSSAAMAMRAGTERDLQSGERLTIPRISLV
jgi:hypothetical protein